MLTNRTPELVRLLMTNFDALFNILNFLSASVCLGASFGFDERAVAFLLVPFPLFFMVVLGDATMTDTEFDTRRYFLLISGLLAVSGVNAYGGSLVGWYWLGANSFASHVPISPRSLF